MNIEKVIVIGSGPSGYTAAIYLARANLAPLLFEGFYSGTPGGQLMTTTEVENFPGFSSGIKGPDLINEMRAQAEKFGTRLITKDVKGVNIKTNPFEVYVEKEVYFCNAIIIATGAKAKRLDIPGTRDGEFWQKGVTACAVCDGAAPIFRNKKLFVIGGGDSALEEALFLTRYAEKVFIVNRGEKLRASQVMYSRAIANEKIEILRNSQIVLVCGDEVVRSVTIKNSLSNEEIIYDAAGVFFCVGHEPNTVFLNSVLDIDKDGYIVTRPGSTFTSVEGVFAAGDVQDRHYKQAVTAAGSGCMAALDCERWLSSRTIKNT